MDTQGSLYSVNITAANINDRDGLLKQCNNISNFKLLWLDMGYTGYKVKETLRTVGIESKIIKRPSKWGRFPDSIKNVREYCIKNNIDIGEGFRVLPRRWVVERTFAWFNKFRRLAKDYEFSIKTSVTMLWIAMFKILVRRIAKCS